MGARAVRFRVTGRVQGVGFRYFVSETATGLGLGGWVRNLADGAVEVVAEGDSAAIGRLESALRRGPRMAYVDRVESEDVASVGGPAEFRIRR